MKVRLLISFITCVSAASIASTATAKKFHVVDEGDTLWEISKSYGCPLDALREENGLEGDRLPVGRRLHIPVTSKGEPGHADESVRVAVATTPKLPARALAKAAADPDPEPDSEPDPTKLITYKIASGDTLGAIATQYDTSIDDLVKRNGLKGTDILAGASLRVLPGAHSSEPHFTLGQSIGATNRGQLRNPTRLKAGPGYFIRRPERSYGAEHTIAQVRKAVQKVRMRHSDTHRLAVGDISARQGGKISMHASHQSGRDIDLGFYFKSRPAGYPQAFADATPKNLNFSATWTLLMSFVETHSEPAGVEKIFISYETQRLLYNKARKSGISKAKLSSILQYPNGRSSTQALVRHEPGHNEHMHVRFSCPPDDETCK